MARFLLLTAAAAAFAQHDNYYSPAERVRWANVCHAVTGEHQGGPETRVDQIGKRLAAHSPQFQYQFFVFDGGQPSQDTAPAAAFPADWRRLQLDEPLRSPAE
jgi:hypothetical protein